MGKTSLQAFRRKFSKWINFQNLKFSFTHAFISQSTEKCNISSTQLKNISTQQLHFDKKKIYSTVYRNKWIKILARGAATKKYDTKASGDYPVKLTSPVEKCSNSDLLNLANKNLALKLHKVSSTGR